MRTLSPLTTPQEVREALEKTSEGVALLRTLGRQPYHDLPDLTELLPAARVDGVHLEPLALLDVASFIEGGCEIAQRVARAEGAPGLAREASVVPDMTDLAQLVRRAILPTGEVADDASPKLQETRRGLTRLRAQLQSVMEGFLRGKDADRLLQDKLVTTRNDRYVLLLKAEHRGQIPGIIHGGSGSGASLFVEPMPAVELNNDIVSLQEEERAEVVRILRDLTSRVGARSRDLARTVDVLGQLDAVQARALCARDMGAVCPVIAEKGRLDLDLRDARHPLLIPALVERLGLERRTSREPVPVSITVGFGKPVLVISGPNTGGKTVALKTVGLLALMAQCGLHVPAAEGSVLPVFKRVFADIGDEQSIAANLSTFSAHLAGIVEMTRDLQTPALVLLDEVGAGTDPAEGGALGTAVVDHFRAKGAMVVATTHHGLLKAYAQSMPDVACASFGYDPATYEPTYKLALGVAGRSLALEMAERLGLDRVVVADARARLDQKDAQAEALLKQLETEQARLRRDQAQLAHEQAELHDERARQRDVEQAMAVRRRKEIESFRKELDRRAELLARQAADAIAAAVRKVEEQGARPAKSAAGKARGEAVTAIRQAREEARAPEGLGDDAAAPESASSDVPIAVGVRARVSSLGVVGEVMGLSGDEVELAVGGKRLRVPREELVGLAAPVAKRSHVEGPARGMRPAVPAEINLVGLTVDEALPRVDKLLDDAALSDRRELRVIHGFGAGRLRKAVAQFLDGHPHVASIKLGAEGRGGVTVVELKE
ncbi:MAG TPA: Smr/MutS family protein [Vicinamibacteria bacterium]|nr:Smr/MutS family protein [Vicinamibacteria bacterium]